LTPPLFAERSITRDHARTRAAGSTAPRHRVTEGCYKSTAMRVYRILLLVAVGAGSRLILACGGQIATNGVSQRDASVDRALDAASALDVFTESAADGATDGGAIGHTSSCMILASNYDESCTADSDCQVVTAGDYCTMLCPCGVASINVGAVAQFNRDVSSTPVGSGALPWGSCLCTSNWGPCCRQGKCQAACYSPSDALPACADAGGTCVGPGGGTVAWFSQCPQGPPNSCAYPDEVCCLPGLAGDGDASLSCADAGGVCFLEAVCTWPGAPNSCPDPNSVCCLDGPGPVDVDASSCALGGGTCAPPGACGLPGPPNACPAPDVCCLSSVPIHYDF
jgi:hypothetical protein